MIKAPMALMNDDISITVIGVGGTGSYLATMLGQMAFSLNNLTEGAKTITLHFYDDDTVSEANVGRSNFYPCDIGLPKAEVIAERLRNGLGVDVYAHNDRLEKAVRTDILITCVDSGKTRHKFGKDTEMQRSDALWVDVGNGAHDGQVTIGHLCNPLSGTKYPNVYDLFGDTLLIADDDDMPSCSLEESLTRQDMGVNIHAASRTFNAIWQLIRYGQVGYSVDFFNFRDTQENKVVAEPQAWATFGYQAVRN